MRHSTLAVLGAALLAATGRAADGRDVPTPAPLAPSLMLPEPPPPVAGAPTLSLVWFDPQASLPEGSEATWREVASIFHGIGVDVRWTRGGLGTVYGASALPEIPVILLPADPSRARADEHVMGLVMRQQEPSRAIWVFLRSVRWTLGHPLWRRKPSNEAESRDLALALARVVAHEVVHSIAPDEPHSHGGLMRHSLNRRFLLGKGAPLDPQCAAAFLVRLAALLPAPGVPPSSGLRSVPVAGP